MIEITVTKEQAKFLIRSINKTVQDIYDDPDAFGFEEDTYSDVDGEIDYAKREEDIGNYKSRVIDDIIDQLTE